MANSKISALPSATTPLAGAEVLPVVQGGITEQVSVANLTAGRAVSAASLALTTSPLPATSGGTGQASYAVGDLLYASTTTALSKLAGVATGNALISGGVGVAPSYGKIGLTTHVSGVLPVANGGTNASTASITSFNNITGYSASGATGTTSTNLVFSTSPSITTPTLVGDVTVSTGNVVIGTSGKGITDSTGALTSTYNSTGITTNGINTSGKVYRQGTYTAGATTPSVTGISFMTISNTSPTTITNFTGAVTGQIITLWFNDANTTINRSNAYLSGGVNFVSTANDTLTLIQFSGLWYEAARGINA